MGLVPMHEILNKANEEYYAVGGFNINNMEFLQGIIWAAEETNSPLILQASEGAIRYIGMDYVINMVKAAVKDTHIPVALHLDHGSSYEVIMKCIREGFSSVMFDGSKYSFEENIRLTQEVVKAAHSVGVTVEAELGKIGGSEEYVEKTEVDALAIAIGTAHGVYKGKPELDFDRLEEIKSILNMPLVLHGASGVPEEDIRKAVKLGINKVNVNTAFQQAFTAKIRELFENDPELYDPRKYCGPGRDAISEAVKEKIEMLGSKNKA